MERLQVRRERWGQGIESDFFTTIRPEGIARDFGEHFEAVHELDDAAGFKTLAWIGEARAAIFVTRETAAGELAVHVHDSPIIVFGSAEEFLVLRLQVI